MEEWDSLKKEVKEDCFKYLTLLKRFNKQSKLITVKYKRWLLDNADLPTDLIPEDTLDEMELWL